MAGSSPRVRGTLRRFGLYPSDIRFIPACAGNTNMMRRLTYGTTVHPRVCGEHVGFPSRIIC